MRNRASWACAALCALGMAAANAVADEVVFNNGDKLTGKIERLEDGKLIITSKVAGEVKVELKEVQTFSTDEPIEIHLADGTVLRQKVTAAEAGKFALAPGGAVQPQAVEIAQIKKVNPPKAAWTGSIAAGFLMTRGNTFSDNANIDLQMQRRGEIDRITLQAAYLYGRQKDPDTGDKSTITDNWFALGKYDYFFTPKFYVNVFSRVEKDRIADLDLRLTAGAGVGYQWIESAGMNFSTEAGLAWFYEDYSNTDETSDHVALRLAYHFDKTLNDSIKLFHNLEYYPSIEELGDYFVVTDLGIRASLTKNFFTEWKALLQYDATPAPGAHNTDVRYIGSVGWAF